MWHHHGHQHPPSLPGGDPRNHVEVLHQGRLAWLREQMGAGALGYSLQCGPPALARWSLQGAAEATG